MIDAEIIHIKRRERALWRRYMSRCARAHVVPIKAITDRVRGSILRALEAVAEARRQWVEAHAVLQAALFLRALGGAA